MNYTTVAMAKGLLACAKINGFAVTVCSELAGLLENSTQDESLVPIPLIHSLFEQVAELYNCPHFPLIFGQWLVGKEISLVGYICENCLNLEESFSMTLRYSSLGKRYSPVLGSAKFSMKQAADLTLVGVEYQDSRYEKFGSEATIARVVSSIRKTVRNDFPFREVHFKHSPLSNESEYAKVFNCPVKFNQGQNCMIFSTLCLQEKVVTAQPYIKKILVEYVDKMLLEETPKTKFAQLTQDIIISNLVKGKVSLSDVSKALNLSESTLQRKLSKEKTSFKKISEQTRKSLAKQYLAKGLSVTNVTFLLGFSDTSAFSRAFKRWYRVSPSDY